MSHPLSAAPGIGFCTGVSTQPWVGRVPFTLTPTPLTPVPRVWLYSHSTEIFFGKVLFCKNPNASKTVRKAEGTKEKWRMWHENWALWQKALWDQRKRVQNQTDDNNNIDRKKEAHPERQQDRRTPKSQDRTKRNYMWRQTKVGQPSAKMYQTSQKVLTKQESSLSPWQNICLVRTKTQVESPALETNKNY